MVLRVMQQIPTDDAHILMLIIRGYTAVTYNAKNDPYEYGNNNVNYKNIIGA